MNNRSDDTSDELLAQARLKVLGHFSASLVHDLRSSMAVVRYGMDRLRREGALSTELSGTVDAIDAEMTQVNWLLTRIMDVTYEPRLTFAEVDLAELWQDVVLRTDPQCRLTWHFNASATPAIVRCDRDRIRQVFENLVLNSLRAMMSQGELYISTRREGEVVIIDIRDTGPGIAEAVRTNLFDPFVTTKSPGMGLGLTYAREILSRHGGSICVIDTSDAGTAFRILLPASARLTG